MNLRNILELIKALLDLLLYRDDDPVPPKDPPKDPPKEPEKPPIIPLPPVIPVPPVPGKDDLDVLRKDLLAFHNKIRAAKGEDDLWLLGELNAMAQEQAEYQAKINGWRDLHGRPPGRSFKEDLKKLTYDYRSAGENAAAGHATALDVTVGWRNSPGHYRNMINDRFTYVGFGYAKSSKGTNYWVAIFVG